MLLNKIMPKGTKIKEMRKVIYKEWVKGVETEEYKNAPVEERAIFPSHYHFIKGTNCNVEKEGLFHGFYPSFDFIGSNHEIAYCTVAIIEDEEGKILQLNTGVIRFIDNPEDGQRAEFAKAAMQGIISNESWVNNARIADDFDEYKDRVAAASCELADALISELKKQKP